MPRSLADDMRWGAAMLRANLGRGWFSYDQFSFSPEVYTDASKSSAYTGGGYVEVTGQYSYFRYGSSAKRRPIDELEGDVVRLAAEHLGGPRWSGTIVKFHIDNQAFQRSGVKGWSAVDRLNDILKDVFKIAVYFRCIFLFQWIPTATTFWPTHCLVLTHPPPFSPTHDCGRFFAPTHGSHRTLRRGRYACGVRGSVLPPTEMAPVGCRCAMS